MGVFPGGPACVRSYRHEKLGQHLSSFPLLLRLRQCDRSGATGERAQPAVHLIVTGGRLTEIVGAALGGSLRRPRDPENPFSLRLQRLAVLRVVIRAIIGRPNALVARFNKDLLLLSTQIPSAWVIAFIRDGEIHTQPRMPWVLGVRQ